MIHENKSGLTYSWEVLKKYMYSYSSNEEELEVNESYNIHKDEEEQIIITFYHKR